MFSYKYVTLNRRGYKITLLKKDYETLKSNGYYISLSIKNNKPSTVQLTKNNQYCGTLKSFYGASGFKDSNVCNFKLSNLIHN